VGYSHQSYGYRDIGGVRVHQSIRSAYGREYGAGDVIGVMIDFNTPSRELQLAEERDGGASAGPADGERQLRAEVAAQGGASKEEIEAILHNGLPPTSSSPGAEAPSNGKHTVHRRWWGSSVRFFVNGEDQGVAFIHLTRENRIHPSVSMYGGGSVRLNPGPVFSFPPDPNHFPSVSDTPAASPSAQLQQIMTTSAASGQLTGLSPGGMDGAAVSKTSCPKSSPWKALCEVEDNSSSGCAPGAIPLISLSSSAAVSSSTLVGTGLLRVGSAGGAAYNFKNTQFAYAGSKETTFAGGKAGRKGEGGGGRKGKT